MAPTDFRSTGFRLPTLAGRYAALGAKQDGVSHSQFKLAEGGRKENIHG